MCARNQEIILWSSAGTLQLFKIFLGENLLTTLSGDQILVSSTYASDATSVRFHGPLSDDQLLVFFELCFRCISAHQIFHYASDAISAHQVLNIFSGRTPKSPLRLSIASDQESFVQMQSQVIHASDVQFSWGGPPELPLK